MYAQTDALQNKIRRPKYISNFSLSPVELALFGSWRNKYYESQLTN
jgi:hypothetical protein